MIKKLFALRFIKDTMLYASLKFYLLVLIDIFPWIKDLCSMNREQNVEQRALSLLKIMRK
jgi:hypothetical protein